MALIVFCVPVLGSVEHLVLGCVCEGTIMLPFGLAMPGMTGDRKVLSLTLISGTGKYSRALQGVGGNRLIGAIFSPQMSMA